MNLLFTIFTVLLVGLFFLGGRASEEARVACSLQGGTYFHGQCVRITPLQTPSISSTNKVFP